MSQLLQHPLLQDPLFLVGLFLGGSLLMVWRLEHMTRSGLEGTVLGTLVMPYCSGIGNIIFVFVAARAYPRIESSEVVVNCLVNNVTNMTLLLGLPAWIWSENGRGRAKPNRKRKEVTEQRLNRLSTLLTLMAVLFFTGAAWALGSGDGTYTRTDGFVLVGLFLFWQCFHLFDVLKTNVRENRSLSWLLALDILLLLLGAFDVYLSIQGLVDWISRVPTGFLSANHVGWLSGWLMVLPNAVLALYYGWRRKPEVIYTSQIGDGHICIPLCLGLAALMMDVPMPGMFQKGVLILVAAVAIHLACVGFLSRLPRSVGAILVLLYAGFVLVGWI